MLLWVLVLKSMTSTFVAKKIMVRRSPLSLSFIFVILFMSQLVWVMKHRRKYIPVRFLLHYCGSS